MGRALEDEIVENETTGEHEEYACNQAVASQVLDELDCRQLSIDKGNNSDKATA